MLHNVGDLRGYAIRATDGVIGAVDDLYFDDEDWAVRYLIVDTGSWLAGRRVLISPLAIGHPNWSGRELPVALTKEQVQYSPDIDTQKPVSRQHEASYYGYYEYPRYWAGARLLDAAPPAGGAKTQAATDESDECHLRSYRAVIRSRIHATDGEMGHVTDMLVDDDAWAIRYLIVNTGHWWAGHHVVIAPQWITSVSWAEGTVSTDLSREAVRHAPPYDLAVQLSRQQEQSTYEHYGRHGYWVDRHASETATKAAK